MVFRRALLGLVRVLCAGGVRAWWRSSSARADGRLWQWLVFGSAVAQILLFVISLPYTWFGGGGSVGNRYFMGVYGIFVFLIPPIASIRRLVIPWIVGALFVGKLVINPFVSSFRPGVVRRRRTVAHLPGRDLEHQRPADHDRTRSRAWAGSATTPGSRQGRKDPGFQIYFVDRNAFQRGGQGVLGERGVARRLPR